jgi:glycosyltransferase involved in cell wall biosynthesis
VCFFGKASPAQVVRLLNGCQLVAVPSRAETFGLAALEALAAGKPVLATRVGGMAQFLMDVCDRLRDTCAPPVTLAAPTVEALGDGLRERLAAGQGDKAGAAVRSLVLREYSWAEAARRYAQVFEGS